MIPAGLALPAKARDLIPHRQGMCLLDTFDEYTPATGGAEVEIRKGTFVAEDGILDSVILIEYLAQLCACQAGYRSQTDGRHAKLGFLVGVENFRFGAAVRTGDRVRLLMRREVEVGPVFHASGTILLKHREIASGTLKFWEQEETQVEKDDEPGRESSGRKGLSPSGPVEANAGASGSASGLSALAASIDVRLAEPEYDDKSGRGSVRITYDSDFPAFQGHFPGYPILPGVALLETGLVAASRILGVSLRPSSVRYAKFGKLVFPGDKIIIEIRVSHHTGSDDSAPKGSGTRPGEAADFGRSYVIDCTFKREAETCASFSVETTVVVEFGRTDAGDSVKENMRIEPGRADEL